MATGEIAGDFIKSLAKSVMEQCEDIEIDVYPIKNNFFGGGVSVSGLVCGCDIIEQLKNVITADILMIPHSMLRDDDNIFLDDSTVEDVEKALGVKIVPVLNDGYDFVEKIIGEELEF